MRLSPSLSLLIILIILSRSVAAEPLAKESEAKKYRDLASQLVSPNKEPMIEGSEFGDDPSVRFPPGYDVKAQQRIKAARQALFENIEDSLPYLVEALDDKRYSMTIAWGEGENTSNDSVGKVCRDIIKEYLEVYRDKMKFNELRWHFYNYPISKKWYEKRKGRSIAKLQIEAIDWAIDRHKAEPKSWAKEDRSNEIPDLRKLRDSIAKSDRPAEREHSRTLPLVTSDRGPKLK
jgi:hypothetical protein